MCLTLDDDYYEITCGLGVRILWRNPFRW